MAVQIETAFLLSNWITEVVNTDRIGGKVRIQPPTSPVGIVRRDKTARQASLGRHFVSNWVRL
jgi:hypothetical protein